jgi:hypothetical protein
LIEAAPPACAPLAAKTVAVAKTRYSRRDLNGNVMVATDDPEPWSALVDDLEKAALLRHRALARLEFGPHIPDKRR